MTESSNLIDPYGRKVEYIRLSVTDRCDLRCNYCMPKGFKGFEQPPNWLDFDEIERVLAAFARLGLQRVRLTGGEPLLRKDLPQLAARIKSIPGIDDLSLSTNATQLSRHAVDLKQAGVDRINVSLDTLDQQRFTEITGRDSLHKVLDGLEQAKQVGFTPVKVNMVMTPQTSEQELDDMVAYCMDHQFVLRLIEIMPMGDTGRNAGFVDLQPIKQRLQQRFDLIDGVVPGAGPARYLKSKDGTFSIGFITPLSQHFCATCNRVRLAVDGTLYLCLGNEHKFEFRPLLRQGISDDELLESVLHAITLKPERHEFRESPQRIVRFMSHTGG